MADDIPTINICDFTIFPTARYISDGSGSAEAFFKTKLSPFLNANSNKEIAINFDNTWGYASSFKNELAIRLAKKYPDTNAEDLRKKIKLISFDEPGLIDRFWEEYREAQNETEK